MITQFIVDIPAYLILMLIGILPVGQTVPPDWIAAVYQIWAAVNAFSFIVPVDTLLSVLTLALFFHLAIFGFKAFHWIITKIPGIG